MKKIKTKTKKSPTASPKKIAKIQVWESHYLAIALAAFLLLEGFLITSTRASDWQKSLSVLDVSFAFEQTVVDTTAVLQPVIDTVVAIDTVNRMAAAEMAVVLDLSDQNVVEDITFVPLAVHEFYQQATTEMAMLLDMSSMWPDVGQVAGASI